MVLGRLLNDIRRGPMKKRMFHIDRWRSRPALVIGTLVYYTNHPADAGFESRWHFEPSEIDTCIPVTALYSLLRFPALASKIYQHGKEEQLP